MSMKVMTQEFKGLFINLRNSFLPIYWHFHEYSHNPLPAQMSE